MEGWEGRRVLWNDHAFAAVCFTSSAHSRTTTLRFSPCYNVNVESRVYRMIKGPWGNEGMNISEINAMNITVCGIQYASFFLARESSRNLENVRRSLVNRIAVRGTLGKSYFASIRKYYVRLIILTVRFKRSFRATGETGARRASFLKNHARARRSVYHIGIHVARMITRSGTIIIPHRRARFIE